MTSTEAEVKAAGLLAQTLEYIVPLWSELAGSKHGSVRCVMDNQTAIKHVSKGADAPAAAPYLLHKKTLLLRHKRMVEEKCIVVSYGLISCMASIVPLMF